VQNILNRSSRLDSVNTIQVAADRGTLVLRGIVKDDHERRLAEAIARLTPGVHELRNELAVRRTN
jgi:osmotically-inducible protein OsmY